MSFIKSMENSELFGIRKILKILKNACICEIFDLRFYNLLNNNKKNLTNACIVQMWKLHNYLEIYCRFLLNWVLCKSHISPESHRHRKSIANRRKKMFWTKRNRENPLYNITNKNYYTTPNNQQLNK